MSQTKVCKFLFPSMTEMLGGKIVYDCHRNGFGDVIHNVDENQCEKCEHFVNRYIEYPLTINGIDIENFDYDKATLFHKNDIGQFCAVRPCDEQYNNKTFVGIFLGDLPAMPRVSHNTQSGVLKIKAIYNPAIFVPELKKIVFGMESFWYIIKSPEDMKDITDDDIDGQWYIQALKKMTEKGEIQNGNES